MEPHVHQCVPKHLCLNQHCTMPSDLLQITAYQVYRAGKPQCPLIRHGHPTTNCLIMVLHPLSMDADNSSTQAADQLCLFQNAHSQVPGNNSLSLVKVTYDSGFSHFWNILSLERFLIRLCSTYHIIFLQHHEAAVNLVEASGHNVLTLQRLEFTRKMQQFIKI